MPLTETQVRQMYTTQQFPCAVGAAKAAEHFPAASMGTPDYLALLTFLCNHDFAEQVIAAIPHIDSATRNRLERELAEVEKYRR